MTHRAPLPLAFRLLLISLPFVWIGTVRVGFRWIVADWVALFALMAALKRRGWSFRDLLDDAPALSATGAIVVLLWLAAGSALVSLMYITPSNMVLLASSESMIGWQGTPLQRCLLELVRLFQCAAAFAATLLVVRTRDDFWEALRWFGWGAALTAAYAVYSWIGLFVGTWWPLLPGTFANVYAHRVGGTFQEPVAFGGFMLSAVVVAFSLADRPGTHPGRWWALVGLFLFAALTALSTLAFIGLAVVIVTHVLQERGRSAARLVLLGILAFALILAVLPARLISQQGFEKVWQRLPSWQDRLAGWRTAGALIRAYPITGIGPGLYAYNARRYFPEDTPDQYRGARINSPVLEVTAEIGVAGGLLMLFMVACLVGSIERRGRDRSTGALTRFARSAAGLLLVLGAGYYTSRYAFLWVIGGLAFAAARLTDGAETDPTESPA